MGFKKLLKSIIPRPVLKTTFGWYNQLKIATIDRWLFPEQRVPLEAFKLYRKGYPFVENGVRIDALAHPEAKKWMNDWYRWTQEEFILEYNKPCCIEPTIGWAISYERKLLYYSLGISRTPFLPRPSFIRYVNRKQTVRVARLISFRDTGEENYFHFFNDVVAKYFFLRRHDISFVDSVVLVGRRLWEKPYFQWYMAHVEELRQLRWLIQDTQYVYADQAVFCKPLTHRPDLFEKIFAPLRMPSNVDRKIFITRNKNRLRFIENIEAVEVIVRRHGLEMVDTDLLSPEQQRELFASASVIVGIHGAGLTNMCFREGSCRILEIFPPPTDGYLPFHYIMLASLKGFDYQAMIGTKKPTNFSGSFEVDISELERNVIKLL